MLAGLFWWYCEWALPGIGMFSEAYIVFSAGQLKPFQTALYPACFKPPKGTVGTCNMELVNHVGGYIQICGIMAGMLLWGYLADITGRKWGSRCVMAIMLSGVILLTFSPFVPSDNSLGYYNYFLTAQTWFGFGVGGEYPLASSSAAERSEANPELQMFRGRQVALVFSNQGMGNFVNVCIIIIAMVIFEQQTVLTAWGSRNTMILMYGVGAFVVLMALIYRSLFLHESKMYVEERAQYKETEKEIGVTGSAIVWKRQWISMKWYWQRQWVASISWICNDFAFYGNKLQQNVFISILFGNITQFKKQQWTILNSFIALTGYYFGAWLIDYPWYGRRLMTNVGFMAMFVFYIIIYAQWDNMGNKLTATPAGAQAFQALYYLSSFFNQFGPNVTTWIIAGEIFPTDIRATYHGFAACMGKLGAIISALWISYIGVNPGSTIQPPLAGSDKSYKVFLISAIWALAGFAVTWVWMPDTTRMELKENDRVQRYIMAGRFSDYHGEWCNPKHLSPWEIYVLGWSKQYDPEQDEMARKESGKVAEMDAIAAEQQKVKPAA